MPARTKRRAKFDFRGRPFVWWIEGDRCLRISSLDKKFVIAFHFDGGTATDSPPAIAVIGQEFPGLESSEPRPVFLLVAQPTGTMGAWVDGLLRWCFDPGHELIRSSRSVHIGR